MIKNNVWTSINKNALGKHEKVLTTTWAMKKNPNSSEPKSMPAVTNK
jgi:hypothetical protein